MRLQGSWRPANEALCEYSTQPGVDSTSLSSEVEAERRLSHVIRRTFQRDHLAEHAVEQLEDPAATLTCQAVAIVDRGNWEAVCAALLVREMLVPQMSTAPKRVPHVLTEDDALPPDTECALILCTNGCFHSAHFAKQLLAAAAVGVHFIPVVAEENFHFPTEALYEEVRRRAPSTSQSQTFTAEHLVTVIGTIFEEIGIDVVLQGAEEIIAVHVAAIAGRLQETRSKRPLHFEAPVHNNPGTASLHSSESSEVPDRAGDLSASEGFLDDFEKI